MYCTRPRYQKGPSLTTSQVIECAPGLCSPPSSDRAEGGNDDAHQPTTPHSQTQNPKPYTPNPEPSKLRQVFGVPLDKMTPDVRRKAKAINFGIIYGQSAFGLAKGLSIPVPHAKKYIETYFQRYPGIQAYMTSARALASDKGYVETLFGRRCHIVNMAKTGALRSYADRQAINAPIQGTAADIIKRAMVRMEGALAEAGLGARMLLQVRSAARRMYATRPRRRAACYSFTVLHRPQAPLCGAV